MNILLSIFVLFYANHDFYQEKLRLGLTDEKPDCLYISDVVVSPSVFYENIVDEYNAGFKYRIITILSGIYSIVYIDKLSLNVEGDVSKQHWSRKIELRELYRKYSLTEESNHLEAIRWVDNSSFTFNLSDMNFIAYIVEEGSAIQVIKLQD
jgi:hypothetical protein